jgi:hypothetical protein
MPCMVAGMGLQLTIKKSLNLRLWGLSFLSAVSEQPTLTYGETDPPQGGRCGSCCTEKYCRLSLADEIPGRYPLGLILVRSAQWLKIALNICVLLVET